MRYPLPARGVHLRRVNAIPTTQSYNHRAAQFVLIWKVLYAISELRGEHMIETLQDLTGWLVAIAGILVCIMLAIRSLLIQYGSKKGNWRKKY